ncbi:MAG: hypothetical protein J6X44_04480, partial [Thermoguttaceae bacterium]|nr:hypothetical protein [Thermoguttaceae bacterium]
MTVQSDQRIVFTLVFIGICVFATSGCERSDTSVPKVDLNSTAADEDVSVPADDKSQRSVSEAPARGVDAARVLSDATNNFARIFSDDDEEGGSEKGDSIDVS